MSAAITGGVAMAGTGDSGGAHLQNGIFSAYIDQGPDKGLAIWGALSGRVDSSGKVSGTLKGDRPPVRVTGMVNGKSVKLDFHLPGGRVLSGQGRSADTITDFEDIPTAGTFTGPRKGDSGVWDQVKCTSIGRPGVAEEAGRMKCVTSEGKVFYVNVTPPKN